MRMAFKHLKEIPKDFKFIADGYSAYPLAAQQFFRESKGKINFDIPHVIGLTNADEVSTEFRPFKQMIERLNRTYKASYRLLTDLITSTVPTTTLLSVLPTITF